MAAVGAAAAFFLSRGQTQLMDSISLRNKELASLRAQQAMALGSFLLTNSLILCREDGWKGLGTKCRWGGTFLQTTNFEKKNPKEALQKEPDRITPEDYKLSNSTDNSNLLTFTATIPSLYCDPWRKAGEGCKRSDTNSADPNDSSSSSLKQITLAFDLIDGSKIESIVGTTSQASKAVDKDKMFVLMTPVAKYLDSATQEQSVFLSGAIRRPLGTPRLKLPASPACVAVCEASIGESPSAECRGPQEVPEMGETVGSVIVTNDGPGPLYQLKFKKIISYDPDYYPNKPDDVSTFNALATDEVIMPGRSISVGDSYPCVKPKMVSKDVSLSGTCSRRRGTCPPGNTATSTTINKHQEPIARVRYDFDLDDLNTNLEPAKVAVDLSASDPDRDGVISQTDTLTQTVTEKTTVTIKYIATH
jgi:hypothetical protein